MKLISTNIIPPILAAVVLLMFAGAATAYDYGSLPRVTIDYAALPRVSLDYGSLIVSYREETPDLAVCRCQGGNPGVCFCVQKGIACGCNPTKGSIWNTTDAGKPINKTGQYALPSWKPDPVKIAVHLTDKILSEKPAEPAAVDPYLYTTRQVGNRTYWTDYLGEEHYTWVPLSEGMLIGSHYQYVSGRVKDLRSPRKVSAPASQTVSAARKRVAYTQCSANGPCRVYYRWE